ncbi:hypothetical protein Pst134EB_030747 [Puccinia striiformis f. sp. tritici]|nr:hypothetical protein Pst134EB_030747 [Puccinia striiformis f. sp. tritici]
MSPSSASSSSHSNNNNSSNSHHSRNNNNRFYQQQLQQQQYQQNYHHQQQQLQQQQHHHHQQQQQQQQFQNQHHQFLFQQQQQQQHIQSQPQLLHRHPHQLQQAHSLLHHPHHHPHHHHHQQHNLQQQAYQQNTHHPLPSSSSSSSSAAALANSNHTPRQSSAYSQPNLHQRQLQKNQQAQPSTSPILSRANHQSPSYVRSQSISAISPLSSPSFSLPPPPVIPPPLAQQPQRLHQQHHHNKFTSDSRSNQHHRDPSRRSYNRQSSLRTNLALPHHPSLPKPPHSDRTPTIPIHPPPTSTQAHHHTQPSSSSAVPSSVAATAAAPFPKPNTNNQNPPTAIRHVHSTSTSTLPSSLAPEEQHGLGGPQSAGYFSSSAAELNPWRACSPCKWKVPLVESGLPSVPTPSDTLSIDEEVDETNCLSSNVEEDEWKIRWAKLWLVAQETPDRSPRAGLDELKPQIANQLHSLSLHFVFDSEEEAGAHRDRRQPGLVVWVYEIPGRLGPKRSTTENPRTNDQPPPLIDPKSKSYQSFENQTAISDPSPIKACQSVISHGVLSYSQLFPNVFSRSTTSNTKPLLPHLSHPAKNRAANDLLADDSSQTNTIPAYANLLRALNQHVITLAVQSPDSTAFSSASPTQWIRWGPDRLLSVPRDESLESLYRNLNKDSTRLIGSILTSPPALVVELKCWLSSRVAMCQPSFTARRLAPMPSLQHHTIPPGFPLILAPFPNLRAQYVRMFGRFNHQSLAPSKPGSSSQSPNSPIGRSSWPAEPSQLNASWISQQKKICRAELKHLEKLKQTWRMAAPFLEAHPDAHPTSTTDVHPRRLENWVVCKITTSGAAPPKNNQNSEIELVWPVDHCLLDLETWLASAEQNTTPATESDQAATLMTPLSGICLPRARLANSLMLSTYESTDELAEDAGSYIDWVARERELQRRAAATVGKERTNEKTASPPSMVGGRAGLGSNRGRGSNYPSPRFQRHTSTSTARASPVPSHLITPRLSKKRSRDDYDDRSSSIYPFTTPTFIPSSVAPFGSGIIPRNATASGQDDSPTVDLASNSLGDENRMDLCDDSSGGPATTTHDPPQSSSAALVLSSQLVNTSSQFVSAQQESGSGSTASTISYNTNLFEQPTPGSLSISALTPAHLNGSTPDTAHHFNNNHPSTQPALYSSPITSDRLLTSTEQPAGPSHVDQLAVSEHALRTLSLISSSEPGPSAQLFRVVEPVGYESVRFSHAHTVVDEHYTRRGGKYALPPSPHSFSGQEDEQDDNMMEIVDQELFRTAQGPLLVHVSRKLMRAIDPRVKVARTLFNSTTRAIASDSKQQPFSRVEPLTSSAIGSTTQGATGYGESPATPRSWVPIGSPNDSSDGSNCSDDEDEQDGNGFNRTIDAHDYGSCSSSTSTTSSSSDDEDDRRTMPADNEYQDAIATKIQRFERSLNNVLEDHYRSTFFFIHPSPINPQSNLSIDHRSPKPNHIPVSLRKKLKNWVTQMAGQLEHDPNLEVLLETLLPSSSSKSATTASSTSIARQTQERIVVMDLASVPIINGFDYYRSRVDDEYEIQEDRNRINNQSLKRGTENQPKINNKQQQSKVIKEDGVDQRPYLIKKFTKSPASIIVKINEGKQKITFSLISQLFKYWIKLGFEPVSGQRDFILSIIFPRPPTSSSSTTTFKYSQSKRKSNDHSSDNLMDDHNSVKIHKKQQGLLHLNLLSVHQWLLELAHTYKSCRLGELTIGKIHESKYRAGDIKKEIEGMIGEIEGSKRRGRHTCLIIVDRIEEMKSLGVGESDIVGIDGRPVTRLLISRQQLLDDRPSSLISFGLRLYDSMKIFVHRFKAPGLSFDPNLSRSTQSRDEIECSDSDDCPEKLQQQPNQTDGRSQSKEEIQDKMDIDHPGVSNKQPTKLLSSHAFFLNGIQKPTQLNIRWPPSGIDVTTRHRILHLGYLVAPHRDWVLVSSIDELGQQHQLVLKFTAVDSTSKLMRNHHLQIVKTVWNVLKKIILATNVEWRIVITKLGRLKPVEYEAWCELLSETIPVSEIAFHVTLSSVMFRDIPILKRRVDTEDPSGLMKTSENEAGIIGGEGSDLEMGEVEVMEEGEEGTVKGGGGSNSSAPISKTEEESVAGVEKLFGGPEPIWVSHESTIRPHSSYADSRGSSHEDAEGRSINGTIVHSLSTSYIYHLHTPFHSAPTTGSTGHPGGQRFRFDILGTAATPASVYQANLFQHREEIIHSIVQLSKLKSLRTGFPPSTHSHSLSDNGDKEEEDGFNNGNVDLLLPVHLNSLRIIGNQLVRNWTRLSQLFSTNEDDEEEEDDDSINPTPVDQSGILNQTPREVGNLDGTVADDGGDGDDDGDGEIDADGVADISDLEDEDTEL